MTATNGNWRRRAVLGMGVATAGLAGPARPATAQDPPRERQAGQETPPILFVPGEGDSAALWIPTIWRFESNYYSRQRLFALDMRLPTARRRDAEREPGRSSAAEATAQVAQEVARIRRTTGMDRLVLVGHGRAGNIIRNFLRLNPGQRIRAAILCGTPAHGLIVSDSHMVGSELNGASLFLRQLNAMPGGVPPGIPTFTISSDRLDKFAQADGRFLGLPGVATGLPPAPSTLRGATNITLPGADHLGTAYSHDAFNEMHRIVMGEWPAVPRLRPEVLPALSGRVTGYEAGIATNVPIPGARLRVFVVDPASGRRTGPEKYSRQTAADGSWGPIEVDPQAHHEFELTARGHPMTHIYRAPFPRGTEYLHLRPYLPAADDPAEGALVIITRPRAYFDYGADRIQIGDQVVGGEPGIPSENTLRLSAPDAPQAAMVVTVNNDRLAGLTWPRAEGVTVIELE